MPKIGLFAEIFREVFAVRNFFAITTTFLKNVCSWRQYVPHHFDCLPNVNFGILSVESTNTNDHQNFPVKINVKVLRTFCPIPLPQSSSDILPNVKVKISIFTSNTRPPEEEEEGEEEEEEEEEEAENRHRKQLFPAINELIQEVQSPTKCSSNKPKI